MRNDPLPEESPFATMEDAMSTQEQQLCQFLMGLAERHGYRYTDQVANELIGSLFWCMAGGSAACMELFFPTGGPMRGGTLKLREAQGAVNGAEYTEAARGHACGHIFRAGEATYSCKTCGTDDTCCLCSRCFESTDHRGHMVRISVSPGNSGCCDCGDPEAWKTPMFCTIHSQLPEEDEAAAGGSAAGSSAKDKGKAAGGTPAELEASIRMTIGRVLDFMCDVISCSPGQLRQTKTIQSIQQDERYSRLSATYGGGDMGPPEEYAVLLWNDEKHTVNDVATQVARACHTRLKDGHQRAYETDEIGRSLLQHSSSIEDLLRVAKILEEIKVTVTIRSSRDTFREQMCGTIIEWLGDIAGCSVGNDHDILRRVVCEELLRPWRRGSPATHANVGTNSIDDEQMIADDPSSVYEHMNDLIERRRMAREAAEMNSDDEDGDEDDDDEMEGILDEDVDDDEDDDDDDGEADEGEAAYVEGHGPHGADDDDEETMDDIIHAASLGGIVTSNAQDDGDDDGDVVMVDVQAAEPTAEGSRRAARLSSGHADNAGEGPSNRPGTPAPDEGFSTLVEYAAPVPPPPPPLPRLSSAAAAAAASGSGSGARRGVRERDLTPSDSDTAEPLIAPSAYAKVGLEVPKTPGPQLANKMRPPSPGRYWLGVPPAYMETEGVPPSEDLFQRVRLDWLILFDLRMWKKVRNDLRSLYISTVVTIPEFKRVLGLRFAGLYTTLAQLYLIGDREPDHSIINISLQMLTTPSITAEIVERGNFLTSLMAILYTFLTTRQVGHPWAVASNAVLAFDSGSVTNRRMYHFFVDLKYLFSSSHVQERLRTEDRYMMQFLDLVKLHQGICPNTRAVGEHVEYETDAWIGASLITREINRLCRQFADAFRGLDLREHAGSTESGTAAVGAATDAHYLARAIRYAAKTVILNSIGVERLRFNQAEIREEVRFKTLTDFEFDGEAAQPYNVVRFVVEEQPISFHHALHYTLSWLVECGKTLPLERLRELLSFTTAELKGTPRAMGRRVFPRREFSAEDYLMAAFDYPLRVCAWLAQMKAGMWVRNGISLRHQAGTYRGVSQRDVAHHRDIFLLQTALVVCDPSRVLASIVDRFGMEPWVKGIFEQKAEAQDDAQHLDVIEDMIHLLIVLSCDRTSLIDASADDTSVQLLALRRDIIHVLCFRPLSYSEICNKMPDRFQEQENFQAVLDELTTYKAPDGNADVGTFELDQRHVEEVDPYIAHYNKNQREESEAAYRAFMAKKTGQPIESIVYEPRLRPINSGAFASLCAFTSTGVFAQLIYYSLLYPLVSERLTPSVPASRIETFLQVVLHLVLIAIAEDKTDEKDKTAGEVGETGDTKTRSFIQLALNQSARSNFMPETPAAKTIVSLLDMMSTKAELKALHPKITLILKRMRQKRPHDFEAAYVRLGVPVDRISTASPAYNNNAADEAREKKKRAALDRQARVMAQFQEQQKSFLAKQGAIDWGDMDDEDDDEDMDHQHVPLEEEKTLWKYPGGTCILCQEETDDRRLYGTFSFFTESLILRQTDLQDPDFVREAASTPKNLDRDAESIRPFGVAHENRHTVTKVAGDGTSFHSERQTIGKGFPSKNCQPGTLSIGCGHIMHFHCFEAYFQATLRRHEQQIARQHAEVTDRLEFVCPLCKALGNAFLPIIWKGKEESYPGVLQPQQQSFAAFIDAQMRSPAVYAVGTPQPPDNIQSIMHAYIASSTLPNIVDKASQLVEEAWEPVGRSGSGGSGASSSGQGTPISQWPSLPNMGVAPAGLPAQTASAVGTGSSGGGLPSAGASNMVRELVSVYRRLRRTLRTNDLFSQHSQPKTPYGRLMARQPSSQAAAALIAAIEDETDSAGGNELFCSDTLAQAVGYSVSAVEIQQRGTDAEYGMTLLSKIPEQQLTHLRILCETVTSYIAVGIPRSAGDNRIEDEFRRDAERQHCQLFMAQYLNKKTEHTARPAETYKPLLSIDPFVFLCESMFGLLVAQRKVDGQLGGQLGGHSDAMPDAAFGQVAPMPQIEIAHLLRLCYLAELVKVVYHMGRNIPGSAWINALVNRKAAIEDGSNEGEDPASLDTFAQFCLSVVHLDLDARTQPGSVIDASYLAADALGENRGFDQDGVNTLAGYYRFVKKYALVFLRKSAVLLYAHGGVDFNSHVSPAPELDELERLTEALRVPSFDEMCSLLGAVGGHHSAAAPTESVQQTPSSTSAVQKIVGGWIRHNYLYTRSQEQMLAQLADPAPTSSLFPQTAAAVANPTTATVSISDSISYLVAGAAGGGSSAAAVSTALSGTPVAATPSVSPPDSAPSSLQQRPSSALLSHPGIYELVGLPQHFDQLLDACTRYRCPTTGKDLSDPMMCLLCGDVFCAQAICCLKDEKVPVMVGGAGTGQPRHRKMRHQQVGGAQQHMRVCQRNMGLFLNIRKCCVFYLHRQSGSYGYAPYIDKYGEVDLGFRHGRPLLLNQRRYDAMLRSLWLSHGVPSFIARKLEMDINNGGWETI